jgi:hypothetical protein
MVYGFVYKLNVWLGTGVSRLVILTTQEAEIKRTTVQASSSQSVLKTLFRKSPSQKWVGGVVQAEKVPA